MHSISDRSRSYRFNDTLQVTNHIFVRIIIYYISFKFALASIKSAYTFQMPTSHSYLDDPSSQYCPAAVAAAYITTHGTTLSPPGRHAASRAAVRHQLHTKDHFSSRTVRGLHPFYISVNGHGNHSLEEQKEIRRFQKDSLDDVFDAVSS